jgi:hypothetical protein
MADLAAALAADEAEFGEFLDPVEIPVAGSAAVQAAAYEFEEIEDTDTKTEEVVTAELQQPVKGEPEEEEAEEVAEAASRDMDVVEPEPYKAPQGPIFMDEVALLPQHGKHKGTITTGATHVCKIPMHVSRAIFA